MIAIGLCCGVAVYCLAYSAQAGRPESLVEALTWAVVNVLPWLFAFEAGKRASAAARPVLALLLALVASLLLGGLAGAAFDWSFELIRRIPALAATAALIALVRFAEAKGSRVAETAVELPLAPDQIEWVSAAGNYIEIKAAGRTLIRRASLGAAERALLDHGFVRIHRSTLVRRDRIARVRPDDVILHDGTSLKTGKRYRAVLGG